MLKRYSFVALLILAVSGCGISKEKVNAEEMYIKAASLKRLSSAVESAVQYKNAPPTLEDEALLTFATKHDPRLLKGFDGYALRAKSINKHSALLMCDSDGKRALIEDTGCTGKMDIHHWKKEAQVPCEYTLNTEELCK